MTLYFTTRTDCDKNRVHEWFNKETCGYLFGIQANTRYGEWTHVVGPDGRLILFANKDEAKAEIKRWSKP